MSIISAQMLFNTICKNSKRCAEARCQKKKNHDGCKMMICTETATWGPADTKAREYCKACKTQLTNQETINDYEINSHKCMNPECLVESKGKVKYGLRGTSFATHCAVCAKVFKLVNTGEAVCEYEINNNLCRTQAKCQVNNQNYCKTHGNHIAARDKVDLIDTVLKCIVDGCKSNRAKKQYCGKHAIVHIDGYQRTSGMCCVHNTKRASFKRKDADGGAKYCKECAKDDPESFESTNPMCMICKETRSSWAYGPTAQPTRCKKCTPKADPIWISMNTGRTIVEQLMRDETRKVHKGCQVDGCEVKSPSFGLLWKQPTHCKTHKGDLINVVTTKCAVKGCNKSRSYGYDWRKPIVCMPHKTGNMENVISKRCNQCKIIASYGYEWQRPICCMTHGLQQDTPMQNVVSKQCATDNCSTRPTFGKYYGFPTHCSNHKTDEMTDVVHTKCQHSGCTTRACFGTEINVPEYCIKHKTDDMEDVVHTKCLNDNCITRPSYGTEFGKAEYCIIHKTDNMIDVVSKRCEVDDCMTQASFNYNGLMSKFCGQHKLSDMINVKATECEYDGCSTQASYNIKGNPAAYCYDHKMPDMINVRTKICLVDSCDTQANNQRYKGYCFNCFYDNYPDEPVIFNYKVKERSIMNSISDMLSEYNIDFDKTIIGSGCSRRPDGLIKSLKGSHNIVIEIDEFQHKRKGYVDDILRISEIFIALGKQPLTVIRFNPDHYNGLSNGLFVKNTSTGRDEIKDMKLYEQAITQLVEAVQFAIQNPPEESKDESDSIETIKLRFDAQ
jgi:hypothetical protein